MGMLVTDRRLGLKIVAVEEIVNRISEFREIEGGS